jgi:hypothetical protein
LFLVHCSADELVQDLVFSSSFELETNKSERPDKAEKKSYENVNKMRLIYNNS